MRRTTRGAPLWVFALLAALLTVCVTPAHAATTAITVDRGQSGRTFDGIGAISGSVTANGLCLDVVGAGTANGTALDLWNCNGTTNQRGTVNSTRVRLR